MQILGQPTAAGGKEIWLVEVVSGLETLEPFRLSLPPRFFHRLSILFRQKGGLRLAAVTTVGAEIRRPCSPRCAVPMQRRRVDRPALRHAVARLSGRVSHPPLASHHSRSVRGPATDHRNEPLPVHGCGARGRLESHFDGHGFWQCECRRVDGSTSQPSRGTSRGSRFAIPGSLIS